jgi:hypothetical protein
MTELFRESGTAALLLYGWQLVLPFLWALLIRRSPRERISFFCLGAVICYGASTLTTIATLQLSLCSEPLRWKEGSDVVYGQMRSTEMCWHLQATLSAIAFSVLLLWWLSRSLANAAQPSAPADAPNGGAPLN